MFAAHPTVGTQTIVGHFVAPLGFGILKRPVLRLAQVQYPSHRFGHVDERRFTAFNEVERAGYIVSQHQQV
ncbi:hypothetical protein D3C84_707960 [compost metagenome]